LTGTEISLTRRSNGAIEAVRGRGTGGEDGRAGEKAVKGPRRLPFGQRAQDAVRSPPSLGAAGGLPESGSGRVWCLRWWTEGKRMWKAWAVSGRGSSGSGVVVSASRAEKGRGERMMRVGRKSWRRESVRPVPVLDQATPQLCQAAAIRFGQILFLIIRSFESVDQGTSQRRIQFRQNVSRR
jgi:hypothetical protein